MSHSISDAKALVAAVEEDRKAKSLRLKNLRPFILDNSLRETAVASIVGQTLGDKWEIIKAVKFSGVQYFILGTFSNLKRTDDLFVQDMRDKGLICSNCFCFAELRDDVINGIPDRTLPLGLQKSKAYSVQNAIIEIDIVCRRTNWNIFTADDLCALLKDRAQWVHDNLSIPTRPRPSTTLINMRDFCTAIQERPDRVLHLVKFCAQLPLELRPAGLLFEDPGGGHLPSELGPWVRMVRQTMEAYGWHDGHFLLHVHHNYGLAEAAVMECLASGADGVWAAVCNEGAATGHAGYLTTLINLARMGNPHVARMFNLRLLLEGARKITTAVTGQDVPDREEVYGPRMSTEEIDELLAFAHKNSDEWVASRKAAGLSTSDPDPMAAPEAVQAAHKARFKALAGDGVMQDTC